MKLDKPGDLNPEDLLKFNFFLKELFDSYDVLAIIKCEDGGAYQITLDLKDKDKEETTTTTEDNNQSQIIKQGKVLMDDVNHKFVICKL